MNIPEIPDNSLTEEITEIIRLCGKYEKEYAFVFAPPLAEIEMTAWEQVHGIILPCHVKDWLAFSNGSTIAYDKLFGLDGFIVGHSQLPEELVIIGSTHDESLCFSRVTHEIVRYGISETRRYEDLRDFLRSTVIRSLRRG